MPPEAEKQNFAVTDDDAKQEFPRILVGRIDHCGRFYITPGFFFDLDFFEKKANFSKNASIKLETDTKYPPSSLHSKELPVMGRIAAGVPIEAISQVSHNVAIPGHMLRNGGDHYALEVKGDSMIEEGINDGDIVVIKETKTAVNGDIVVALVKDSEATLKRFFYRGDAIALEAANPAYETKIVPSDQVKVQGRLVGLIRSY